MATATADIDHIVREVLKRLGDVAAVPPGPATAPVPTPRRVDPRELVVADRLVSLATVEGRLAGIRRLVTPPAAVVTPSVVDELKARRIQLVRRSQPLAELRAQAKPVLAVVGETGKTDSLLRSIEPLVEDVNRFPADGLAAGVRHIAEQTANRRLPGVLLTDCPAAALCLANRISAIRAAWAVDPHGVRQALDGIGANVLVVDPARGSVADVTGLINEFAAGAGRSCPSDFQAMLDSMRTE